ncbi:suppressor of fused domain protein [Streptomyces sp. NBC_01221]|uniref:suppressor of fused domain protein n=1 Tax=Streptomyces sp. NBC_01221 TaxID=2903782 RepID=UPI00225B8940|nr:suppressor of fused domain protein [Streptomyces sp. NBC_01221]MCX4791830.1 suppressor of fused domain protein [Streptomyces sp. NBC_01221]
MPELIDHLEGRLGRMGGAWPARDGAPEGSPQVAWFRDGRLPRVQAFATIGLFRTPLRVRTSDRHYHLELLACDYLKDGQESGPLPGVVEFVAERMVQGGHAVLRGDVIPLPVPLPGGSKTALYAALPVYFDDDFFSVTIENGSDVAIVWLVPITSVEADFVRVQGWQAFEQALAAQDPDLVDINRAGLDL